MRFRHEALLYAGEEDFVARSAAFVRDALAAHEPTLVVVGAKKIERLREEIGREHEGVYFADMAAVGHNPARIIPAWHDFVAAHAAPDVPLRGIGEPIDPARAADELIECQRHESLLNLAFADTQSFWLLCPYDTEALPPAVIEEARRSHPLLAVDGEHRESVDYAGLDAIGAPFDAALTDPPRDAGELDFEKETLETVRRFVAEQAAKGGLGMSRRLDLVMAVNEVASNSVNYGGGRGVLRIWTEARRIVCEIRDQGRLDDPLADRRPPPEESARGRGLLIANQLCDLVQIRSRAGGTVVRLHVARAGA